MGNKSMHLTNESRTIIDGFMDILSMKRPEVVAFALAKGLSIANGPSPIQAFDMKGKWEFGSDIIDGNQYLMFKHLIINEQQKNMTDDEVSKYMAYYIEIGIRELERLRKQKSSIEDLKLALLS